MRPPPARSVQTERIASVARALREVLDGDDAVGGEDAAALQVLVDRTRDQQADAQRQQELLARRARRCVSRRSRSATLGSRWTRRWPSSSRGGHAGRTRAVRSRCPATQPSPKVRLGSRRSRPSLRPTVPLAAELTHATADAVRSVFAREVEALVAGLELGSEELQAGQPRARDPDAPDGPPGPHPASRRTRAPRRAGSLAGRRTPRRWAAPVQQPSGVSASCSNVSAVCDRVSAEASDAAWVARDDVERRLRDLDHELLASTRRSAEELEELQGDLDDAGLASQPVRLREQAAELVAARKVIDADVDTLSGRIEAVEGSSERLAAQQELANALATIEQLVPEYRQLAIEEQLLTQFLEQQASSDMGPVVLRAGDYFQRITCGRWTGGQDSQPGESGAPVLVARRALDAQLVGVDGMSEGTRDQLFLALQLATLVEARATGTGVDAARGRRHPARLRRRSCTGHAELLGRKVAPHIQLFLTHHARLVELAREAVDPEVLHVSLLGEDELAADA